MSIPKRVIIEYDDGSAKGVSFEMLDRQTHFQLAKLGLCHPPGEMASANYYLLLRWKDGWQEVVSINHDRVELLRYYVIRRIEDRGRLSFDVGVDDPHLFVLKRMPKEVSSLLMVGPSSVRFYPLESELEKWEGTFEAGGKKEYVKYDKTSSQYPHEFKEGPEYLSELLDGLRKTLSDKGLHPQKLLAMDQSQRIERYKEIAKETCLRGMERQEDVCGFIEFMVRRLAISPA